MYFVSFVRLIMFFSVFQSWRAGMSTPSFGGAQSRDNEVHQISPSISVWR